ncbi:MAG: hypothetical protein GWN11_02840 [Candidatus Dadabacteria bacterium]|nr:hypothetical protein [Candidatus Dadabacteria bacterium]
MADTTNAILVDEKKLSRVGSASTKKANKLRNEQRLYNRVEIKEKIQFGYFRPEYYGISRDITPDGMSIMTDKSLIAESNIVVNIYVVDHSKDDDDNINIIEVEGDIMWVKDISDDISHAGVKFKQPNEELIRYYAEKLRDWNNDK